VDHSGWIFVEMDQLLGHDTGRAFSNEAAAVAAGTKFPDQARLVALTGLPRDNAGVKATRLFASISSEQAHMAAGLWHATGTSNHCPHEQRPLTNSP
jgi:hypothetical protein